MADVGTNEELAAVASRGSRWAYLAAGHTFVVLGVIGAFLPLLPTTIFLILAASCYGKASPALHRRLLAHRTFGPVIRDWQEHRAMSVRSKMIAIPTIIAAFALSVLVIPIGWVKVLHMMLGVGLVTFILRIRTR